jgi:RNA polymerase sigma-70 factor (ECF subfamily)
VELQEIDDPALMGLIEQKKEDALAALYDRYGRLVFSIAYNVVGDFLAAEDITQDIFLRVWEKAHTFQSGRGTVLSWLARMTRNRSIDVLRREAARLEVKSVSWAVITIDPPAIEPNPEELAHLAMEKQRVRAAISALSDNQRETLSLAYFRGYSHSEIARELNQPIGTVKSRLRSAMQTLRQIL